MRIPALIESVIDDYDAAPRGETQYVPLLPQAALVCSVAALVLASMLLEFILKQSQKLSPS